MKKLCLAATLMALSSLTLAATAVNAPGGVISPETAIGFERVSVCGTSPTGELMVSEDSFCFKKETYLLSRYVKAKYPSRNYAGFQIVPSSSGGTLFVFYR